MRQLLFLGTNFNRVLENKEIFSFKKYEHLWALDVSLSNCFGIGIKREKVMDCHLTNYIYCAYTVYIDIYS